MKPPTGDEVEGIKDLLAFYPDKARSRSRRVSSETQPRRQRQTWRLFRPWPIDHRA